VAAMATMPVRATIFCVSFIVFVLVVVCLFVAGGSVAGAPVRTAPLVRFRRAFSTIRAKGLTEEVD